MRAQFVRGIDPKDSMNIGNKHAREAQKLIAAFKEIDPNSNPKMSDEETAENLEMVVVTIKLSATSYSLTWVNSGIEYYIASWGTTEGTEAGGQDTFPKLEQAKEKMMKYLH